MNWVWNLVKRVRWAVVRDPIMLTALVVVVVFGSYTIYEHLRAQNFQNRMDDFRRSAQVQNSLSAIDSLTRLNERGGSSLFCSLQSSRILIVDRQDNSEVLLAAASQTLDGLQAQLPSFSSAAVYLPSVQDGRDLSGEVAESVRELRQITVSDSKSVYCSELARVLQDAYFLQELAKPEGVSALFVGQIENFWVELSEVQDGFRNIDIVPADFADQHSQINDSLNQFAVLLREDTNNVEIFSSQIEEELERLDLVFAELTLKSDDLQQLANQLQLQTAILRAQ